MSYYQSGQDGGDQRLMTHNLPSKMRYKRGEDGEEDLGESSLLSPSNDYRSQLPVAAHKKQHQNKTATDWSLPPQPHLRNMTIKETHMDDESADQGDMATFGDFPDEHEAFGYMSESKRLLSVEMSRN